MWKSLSIFVTCMSLSLSSLAQKKVNLELSCFAPEEVTKIIEKFKEEYVFAGMDDIHGVKNLTTVLFLNKETKTYSIVFHANDQGLVCILSSGTNGIQLKRE